MKRIQSLIAIATLVAAAMFVTGCQSTSSTTSSADVRPFKGEKCPVSGEKLGEMGEPVRFVYQGQEVKLCCKNCRKDFDKDPAKYLSKLN